MEPTSLEAPDQDSVILPPPAPLASGLKHSGNKAHETRTIMPKACWTLYAGKIQLLLDLTSRRARERARARSKDPTKIRCPLPLELVSNIGNMGNVTDETQVNRASGITFGRITRPPPLTLRPAKPLTRLKLAHKRKRRERAKAKLPKEMGRALRIRSPKVRLYAGST